MAEQEPRALFASAYGALHFALNFEDLTIPASLMNKEMAMPQPVDRAKSEAMARSYGSGGRPSKPKAQSVALGNTADRAVMAGWVLQRFQHLDTVSRLVLTLTVMKPRTPCACGAPCCRGWLLRRPWVESVRLLTEHIQYTAELDPDKKGYSTEPRLRQALVEDFARPVERRKSLADLAELAEVTAKTVAAHRHKIHGYLGEVQDRAWEDLAAVFDAHGITGEIRD